MFVLDNSNNSSSGDDIIFITNSTSAKAKIFNITIG
jgi:hypothetical protein